MKFYTSKSEQKGTSSDKKETSPVSFFQPEIEKINGKVAIIIDDLGYNMDIAEKLLQLDVPISFSILPKLRYSKLIAIRANELNYDVLLHLPMEPNNYPSKNPGPEALVSGMNPQEMEEQLLKNLDAIPYLRGINNHMGSKLTEDEEIMHLIMEKIKFRDLFFLDSRTSPRTVAYKVAKEYGVKAAERNIFLDNENDIEIIGQQIIKLGEIAMKNGSAIGIGHPYQNTLLALQQIIPKLKENGIKITPISQLVN